MIRQNIMTTRKYLQRMQHQVEEWTDEIMRLKVFVNEISADTRTTYEKKIKELQENRHKMLKRIKAISSEMAVT